MTSSQYISELTRINRNYEVKYLTPVEKAIRMKVSEVITVVQNKGIHAAINFVHTDVDNLYLHDVVKKLYVEVGLRHARLEYSQILHELRKRKSVGLILESKGFGFNATWTKFILDYLNQFLLEKITFEVARTTRDLMLTLLSTAITEGWGIDKTVENLTSWDKPRYQAATIVRTETNRASNVGATAQSETSDYQQMKAWSSAQDYRVRGRNPKDHADHWSLNGQKIDAEDSFHDPRSGDFLRFPGDPKASAETTINCRCRVVYSLKLDSRGNPIPKRRTTTVIYPSGQPRHQIVTI